MEHYVGLDVSLKLTSICVVNQTESIVQEGMVDSDPEAIASFARLKAPGPVRIGIETYVAMGGQGQFRSGENRQLEFADLRPRGNNSLIEASRCYNQHAGSVTMIIMEASYSDLSTHRNKIAPPTDRGSIACN
jgi:hypothetical protein